MMEKEEKELKPTVEEMFEAYRQYRQRIEACIGQGSSVEVDFDAMPSNRRVVRGNKVRTVASAMVVTGMLILPAITSEANACVLNQGADRVGSVEAVDNIVNNVGR